MKDFRTPCVFAVLALFAAAGSAEAQGEPSVVELPDESEWEEGEESSQFYDIGSDSKLEGPPQAQSPAAPAPAPRPQSLPRQTTPPLSPNAAPTASAAVTTDAKQPRPAEEPAEDKGEKEEIFSLITIAPEVGYLFFPKSEMTFNGISATVDARNGFIGKLHLDIGGAGLALELAPIFAAEAGGITPGVGFGTGVDIASGSMMALGGQLALVYRFELGSFFPNLGIGFHGTYMFGNEIEYGTELYGRIPVGFTAYMGKHIGFVFEVGFMYGVTGIKTPFRMPEAFETLPPDVQEELQTAQTPAEFEAWYYDNEGEINEWLEQQKEEGELPEDYSSQQMAADFAADQLAKTIRFGRGFGIDIVIGIRFP